MKKLLQEQLKDYQEQFDANEKECIELMKNDKPWRHIAKKAAGLKMLIEHCESEINKY